MRHLVARSLGGLCCLVSVAGCDAPPAIVDAAVPVDAGVDAYVPPIPDPCDTVELTRVDGVLGETIAVEFDTVTTTTRPRDLGLRCGNTASELRWAAQEVVEFRVPGEGPVSVLFSAVNAGTQDDFNTVIQARTGACRTVPEAAFPPTCFDDVSRAEVRSAGAVSVTGGDTVYFYVTGYSEPPTAQSTVDVGLVTVEFQVVENTPPTLTAGSVTFAGVDTQVSATATDAEGPLAGYVLSFYTAAGLYDIFGDGVADDNDVITLAFTRVIPSGGSYVGQATVSGTAQYRFAEFCRYIGCTQIGIRVFDTGYAGSDELRVTPVDMP